MNSQSVINILDWLFILKGLGITVFLCFSSMILGTIIGFFIGIMRTSENKVLQYLSRGYVYIIRGTPLLMQLFFVYYGLPIVMGYPIPAFNTALIGLTIYASAYIAEIVKAGINSVDIGQKEAARALGMTYFQEFRRIVLPQAMKVIIPPISGFFIALIKDSSLVSAIGFMELTRSSKLVIARTFQPFTIYIVVAVIYFIICFTLSKTSKSIERRMEHA